jgi:hypothetical protein
MVFRGRSWVFMGNTTESSDGQEKKQVNSGFQSQAVVFTSSGSRNFWNKPATMKLYGHYGKSNLKAHALSPDAPHAPITAKSVG